MRNVFGLVLTLSGLLSGCMDGNLAITPTTSSPSTISSSKASSAAVTVPQYLSAVPLSPSLSTTPLIIGLAPTGTTSVNLYSDAGCTVSLGSGSKATFEGAGISVSPPLSVNFTTSIYAKSTADGGATWTACVGLVNYTHDSTMPNAPSTASFSTGLKNSLTTSPVITFVGSSDPGTYASGVNRYEYAIGTSVAGTNVRAWTSIGLLTSFTATGLTLVDGTSYYVSFRAVDNAGNISGLYNYATPWTADVTPPNVTVSSPTEGQVITSGTYTYTGSCESPIMVNINYVSGTGGPATAICSAFTFTTTVAFMPGPGTKTVSFTQTDPAGNTTTLTRNISFAPADTWLNINGIGTPIGRNEHETVWTGTEMIVWGGWTGASATNTGARYNPTTGIWTPMSTVNAPSARYRAHSVWTGTEMIVWGGMDSSAIGQNTGARYNPSTDTWTTMSTTGAPSTRYFGSMIWTGTKAIIWGGYDAAYRGDGASYDPSSDTWTTISAIGAPSQRYKHTAVWTGSKMVLFGGMYGGTYYNNGGQYNPSLDTWTATTTVGAPVVRAFTTGVWTGSKVFIWGGETTGGVAIGSGGMYDPTLDSWTTITGAGAPSIRERAGIVLTNTNKVIVWGGTNIGTDQNTGAIYDVSGNTWSNPAGFIATAPSARFQPSAVWTGTYMMIWGGGALYNDGKMYYP